MAPYDSLQQYQSTLETQDGAYEAYLAACAQSKELGISILKRSRPILGDRARITDWFIACCWDGHLKEAELLLEHRGYWIDIYSYPVCLEIMCREADVPVLELLLKYGHKLSFYTEKEQVLRYMIRHTYDRGILTLVLDHDGWFDWDKPSIKTLLLICKHGCLDLIKLVFGRLGTSINSDTAGQLFTTICRRHEPALVFFLDLYASVLKPPDIYSGLHNWPGRRRANILIIADLCIDSLEQGSFVIAFEQACISGDLDLIDKMIRTYLGMIQSCSWVTEQGLRASCKQGDIDTIAFILERLGPYVCDHLLIESHLYYDLEVVRMLIDSYRDLLVDSMPKVLQCACKEGDMDMAELLIGAIGSDISSEQVMAAFSNACTKGYDDIVRIMAASYSIIDFRTDSDYPSWVCRISTKTANLLNEIYGTTIKGRIISVEDHHWRQFIEDFELKHRYDSSISSE